MGHSERRGSRRNPRLVACVGSTVAVLLSILVGVGGSPAGAAGATTDLYTFVEAFGSPNVVGVPFTVEDSVYNFDPATTATNATLTITLDPSLTIGQVRFTGGQGEGDCTVASHVITCALGDIGPQTSNPIPNDSYRQFDVTVTPTSVGPNRGIGSAVTSNVPEAVPDPHPNTGSTSVTVNPMQVDLEPGVTPFGAGGFFVGQTANVQLQVADGGPATATAVKVVGSFPSSLTIGNVGSSSMTCSTSGQQVTCTDPSLTTVEEGDFVTVQVTPNAVTAAASVSETVSSATPEVAPDPHPNTASTSISIASPIADVLPLATGEDRFYLAEPATFRAYIDNDGPATARGTTIDVTVPPGFTIGFASASGPVGCTTTGRVVHCFTGDIVANGSASAGIALTPTTVQTGASFKVAVSTTSTEPSPDPHADTVTVPIDVGPTQRILSGTVTDTNGHPIAGATVNVYPSGSFFSSNVTQTASDGTYRFFGLAAGTYQLKFDAGGDAPMFWSGGPVTLGASGDVTGINQVLGPPATIRGTITDTHGNPQNLVEVVVWAAGQQFFPVTSEFDADDGTYSIQVPYGDYQLQYLPGGATQSAFWYPGSAGRAGATIIHLTAGQTGTFSPQVPMTGTVTGRVTHPNTRGIAGVQVQFFASSTAALPVLTVTTNPDGTYTALGLAPATYLVHFVTPSSLTPQWYEGSSTRAGSTPVVVGENTTVSNVNATVVSSASVSGRVTAPGATPVAGVTVQFYASATAALPTVVATTAADGTYTAVDLPAGSFLVHFKPASSSLAAQWYQGSTTRAHGTPVAVAVPSKVTGIDATLSAA